jgi:molybdopterin molybdotransferase
MLTVEEARERVLARFQPLEAEQAPLTEALGRVLADDTRAKEASPPFTNSAMDGYALRSADTRDASEQTPVRLRLVGEVPAGSVYDGVTQPGQAIRILTGAPLPTGIDRGRRWLGDHPPACGARNEYPPARR